MRNKTFRQMMKDVNLNLHQIGIFKPYKGSKVGKDASATPIERCTSAPATFADAYGAGKLKQEEAYSKAAAPAKYMIIDLNKMKVSELKALVGKEGLTNLHGSGVNGSILKSDYVRHLSQVR